MLDSDNHHTIKHCLVTGSSGYVAGHLCRHLLAMGLEVTGVDICPSSTVYEGMYTFQKVNLADGKGLERLPWNEFDAVFHLAAAGVKAVSREWPVCVQVNLLGTLRLMEFLKSCVKPPALIYTHTFYEDFIDQIPDMWENAYVASKFISSQTLRMFAEHYAGGVVFAKLYQIYGVGDSPGNILPYVIGCLRKNQTAHLGSGLSCRDWIDIEDVVLGLVACTRSVVPGMLKEFELGTGRLTSIRDVVFLIKDILDKSEKLLDFDEKRDRGDTVANGMAVKWPDNWQPQIGLEEGILCLIDGMGEVEA